MPAGLGATAGEATRNSAHPAEGLRAGEGNGERQAERLVSSIYEQVPEIFCAQRPAVGRRRRCMLPFDKVLEQFTNLQVRADQMREAAVPQVETPFLKVTLEDNRTLRHHDRRQSKLLTCRRALAAGDGGSDRRGGAGGVRSEQAIKRGSAAPARILAAGRRASATPPPRQRAPAMEPPAAAPTPAPAARRPASLSNLHRTERTRPHLREFQPQAGRPFRPVSPSRARRRGFPSSSALPNEEARPKPSRG